MATYKPTTNTVATYGEQSPAVLALQQSLNAKGANLAPDSKYGPLTAQAVAKYGGATPTPTPAPTAPSIDIPKEKFARGTNPYDTKINDLQSKIDANTVLPRSTEDIFAGKQKMAQGVIDAINAKFNREIEAQNQTNAGYNDVIRARNITEGLGGSDFGTSNRIGQEQKNAKAIQLIENERAAEIMSILENLGSQATKQARQERLDYTAKLGNDIKK